MKIRPIKQLVDRTLAASLVSLFAILLLTVLWQVISRYLLGSPSSFTEEVARFSFIALSLFGAAYVAGQDGHLAIDLLPDLVSRQGSACLRWAILGASLAFSLALSAGGLQLVRTSILLGQTSPVLGMPLGFIYATVPLTGLLLSFYLIAAHVDSKNKPSSVVNLEAQESKEQ